MGREVLFKDFPERIISLVPSQTELICELGCEDMLVGVTKFCVHPAHIRKQKTIVGGTKQFRFDVIDELSPDLIIGNKEENYQEGIEQLAERYPVWMSDIYDLADAKNMMQCLADFCGAKPKGNALVAEVEQAFAALPSFAPLRSLYLIWQNPFMATGHSTFINEMMKSGGFENVIKEGRYPELSDEQIRALKPEVVLLSSEPYPFAEKHKAEIQKILPEAQIRLVDGELFSWYGSRLLKLPAYLEFLREELKK